MYALKPWPYCREEIYPENALILGYFGDRPIYARECVHTLYSSRDWLVRDRMIKIGEKPYKILTTGCHGKLFGIWQTQPYVPPVAVNGIVPRTLDESVALFKLDMLPIGTRLLSKSTYSDRILNICKEMRVDCAKAVKIYTSCSKSVQIGFVVCEQFADDVIKQWEIVEKVEKDKKEEEK